MEKTFLGQEFLYKTVAVLTFLKKKKVFSSVKEKSEEKTFFHVLIVEYFCKIDGGDFEKMFYYFRRQFE